MMIELPKVLEDRINSISDDELEFRGWTRDGMRERYIRRFEADNNGPQPGELAPDFTLKMTSGQEVSMTQYRKDQPESPAIPVFSRG